jgi:predicted kinase
MNDNSINNNNNNNNEFDGLKEQAEEALQTGKLLIILLVNTFI